MQNLKLTLAYQGTRYFGWQNTNNGPSIEGELEKALLILLKEAPLLQAASRTDKGVHAKNQIVNFITSQSPDLRKLHQGLNALLPKDIRVSKINKMPLSFHPTLETTSKEYLYQICMGPIHYPHLFHLTWHIRFPLNLQKMEAGAKHLIGKHDFGAFSNNHRDITYTNTTRELFQIKIQPEEPLLKITIRGDRFLYKMARSLVGTLVYIGMGKLGENCILDLLEQKDRKKAGVTAPAEGLFLNKVYYR